MRKISLIQAFLLLCLGTSIFSASERLRLGDFPTEEEKRQDKLERRRNDVSVDVPAPAPGAEPASTPPKGAPLSPKNEGRAPAGKPATPPPVVPKPPKAQKPAPRPSPKPALSMQERKKRSNELYLQALSASQNGDFDGAYKMCRQALKLDPENLQAERMCERLESRSKR